MGEVVQLNAAPTLPPGWALQQQGRRWLAVRPWRPGQPGVSLRAQTAADACAAAGTFVALAGILGVAAK